MAAFWSVHAALDPPVPRLAMAALPLAFPLFVILWVVADARRRRLTPCFDFGFFVALGFPLSVAWYVLRTRKLWGVVVLAALFGLFVFPFVCAALVLMTKYFIENIDISKI